MALRQSASCYTGEERRLFAQRLFLDLGTDNRIAPHFLYGLFPIGAREGLYSRMEQKTCFICKQEKTYVSPAVRIIPMTTELSFLQSNTEPIDDGGEQGWD